MANKGRREVSDLHPEDVRPVVADNTRYISLPPNYEQTAMFLMETIVDGSHERPWLAMYSVVEQIRYLTATDPQAVARLLSRIGARLGSKDQELIGVNRHG